MRALAARLLKKISATKKNRNKNSTRWPKNLSLKITLTVDIAMSVVGVVTFFSLATMILTLNFETMITKIMSVVLGITLVWRTVPYSKLQNIETTENVF